MSNPNKEVFEYRGQLIGECYNQFFNPNICHVCKSVDRSNLILCNQCCIISYCSEEHKMIHHPYHAKICVIIARVLQVKPQNDTRKFNNWEQWIQSRKVLMESIQEKLDDKMEPYVQQMILWSKSCYICHQQNNLRVCRRCFSANYCDKHANDFHTKHNGAKCDQLMLLLNIDIETISGNITNTSFGFLQFVNEKSCFEEMLEFYMTNILIRRRNFDWLAKDYVRSDYLSEPLTVYSGFKRIDSFHWLEKQRVIIHIIATNFAERDSLPAWEVLLHLVPQIQRLLIYIIGPKLTNDFDEYVLCQHCINNEKKLSCVSISMLYHDFVRTYEKYIVPNMIVGFHAELNKSDTCADIIQEIADNCCPLILSFSSKNEAENDMIKIEEALNRIVKPELNDRNYFSGLAPHKDLKTGDIYFYNEHLIIYDSFYDKSDGSSSLT